MTLYGFVILVICVIFTSGNREDLEGSKLYAVELNREIDFKAIYILKNQIPSLDIWQYGHIMGRDSIILVPKRWIKTFESVLKIADINFITIMEDPKSILENEIKIQNDARQRNRERISFTNYNRYEDINQYLDDLALEYPERVKVEILGTTEEGRDIKAIKISSPNNKDISKPIIVSDAGIHAREWISPSVSLYMIRKLVEDITEADVADGIDWIIIPLINPDGYEYTHTTERLWRKTRSKTSNVSCFGVDVNRNFDYMWMWSGSSSNPCSDIYAGPKAFSEVESQVLRDVINDNVDRVKAYLALHSYGSYFLYPYGYDGSYPSNINEIDSLGIKVGRAIDGAAAPGSLRYLVGNSAKVLNYEASGASDDWAMGRTKIGLSYTLELPGGGNAGFDLPPSRIEQVVRETWEGVLVLARYVIEKNNVK